jgi:hypothetical protein
MMSISVSIMVKSTDGACMFESSGRSECWTLWNALEAGLLALAFNDRNTTIDLNAGQIRNVTFNNVHQGAHLHERKINREFR